MIACNCLCNLRIRKKKIELSAAVYVIFFKIEKKMVLPNFICKLSDFLLLCKLYGDGSFFFLFLLEVSASPLWTSH